MSESESPLTGEERRELLRLAREGIAADLGLGPPCQLRLHHSRLLEPCGTFVTLFRAGQLRGCVGSILPRAPLWEAVVEAAHNAAFCDPRFPPLSQTEFPNIDVEISRLTPPRRADAHEVEVGRHGLYIVRDGARGVLLPHVASERRWDAETFLGETCRKAGLALEAWRYPGTAIYVFESEKFGDHDRGPPRP